MFKLCISVLFFACGCSFGLTQQLKLEEDIQAASLKEKSFYSLMGDVFSTGEILVGSLVQNKEFYVNDIHFEILSTGSRLKGPIPPWMGSLVNSNGTIFCSASLIAPSWVLTAKHCNTGTNIEPIDTSVRLGYHLDAKYLTDNQEIYYAFYGYEQLKVLKPYDICTDCDIDMKLLLVKPKDGFEPIPIELSRVGLDEPRKYYDLMSTGLPKNLPRSLGFEVIDNPDLKLKESCQYNERFTGATLYMKSGYGEACKVDSGGAFVSYKEAKPILYGVMSRICLTGLGDGRGKGVLGCKIRARSSHVRAQQILLNHIELLCNKIESITPEPSLWPNVCKS